MESDALVIIVIGRAQVSGGHKDEALAVTLAHVGRSRTEAGCISHDVSVDPEDGSKLTFVEYWTDMPALLAHFALQSSKDFIAALTPLLAQKPEMKIYQAEEIST